MDYYHPFSRKPLRSSNSGDCNIPDSLLRPILSFLSTHDSARTSVLARRWCSLWPPVDVPSVNLDRDDLQTESSLRANDMLRQFLASCRDYSSSSSSSVSSLRILLHDYFNRPVTQEMSVFVCYSPLPTPMLFIFYSTPLFLLLDLKLDDGHGPRLRIPPELIEVSYLKRLFLTIDTFSEGFITGLLAKSPNLEELTLDVVDRYDAVIEITVPSLRRLFLTSTLSKMHINCPKLESLCIERRSCHLEEFRGYMPSLFSLHLGEFRWCHTLASMLCHVTELSTSLRNLPSNSVELNSMAESFKLFHKLKKLKVHLHLLNKYTTELLLLLLQQTPTLHSLNIIDDREDPSPFEFYIWSESLKMMPKESFHNLKVVSVKIKSKKVRSRILEMLYERV
ncbi:putative FBD-associated F-box protein At5g56820 [Zingiber officinale]|uniref:putative FBD-associated F-box protein At5g56820 n=1 Tax=Zingiber officinale TaxID=94328 RepID=UPI001C4B78E3|nr:putative FBD-associated F-box protein At5g56820 [Zingiber officinale]